MTEKDFQNIRLLSAKERLEKDNLYTMSTEEKDVLSKLKKDFDSIDATVGKTIFYMHEFLGIDYIEIADILNYTYRTVRQRYYDTKAILSC